jgi:hypothetical protein
MGWSKVSLDYKKPLRWWLHKILCEYGWLLRNKDNSATYHHHLKMCFELGFNLRGEKVKENNSKIDN